MIEIVVIIALLIYLAWKEYSWRLEKQDLLDMLKTKDANELRDLKMARNTNIKIEPQKPPDLIPEDQLTNDQFEKAMKGEKVNFPL